MYNFHDVKTSHVWIKWKTTSLQSSTKLEGKLQWRSSKITFLPKCPKSCPAAAISSQNLGNLGSCEASAIHSGGYFVSLRKKEPGGKTGTLAEGTYTCWLLSLGRSSSSSSSSSSSRSSCSSSSKSKSKSKSKRKSKSKSESKSNNNRDGNRKSSWWLLFLFLLLLPGSGWSFQFQQLFFQDRLNIENYWIREGLWISLSKWLSFSCLKFPKA